MWVGEVREGAREGERESESRMEGAGSEERGRRKEGEANAKETYYSVKRDLLRCQKSPITEGGRRKREGGRKIARTERNTFFFILLEEQIFL